MIFMDTMNLNPIDETLPGAVADSARFGAAVGMVPEENSGPGLTEQTASEQRHPHETPTGAGDTLPAALRDASSLPPKAMAIAAGRRALLVRALPLFEAGLVQTETAQRLGCSDASLSRALALGGKGGTAVERCRRSLGLGLREMVRVPSQAARPSDFEVLLGDRVLMAEMRSLYLATLHQSSEAMGVGRHTGSMRLTLRSLADCPRCPAWAAERLKAGAQLVPLLRELRRITPELEQLVRGERKYGLHGPHGQKEKVLRLPDGRVARQLAGYRVVMDDMSLNQPFWCDRVERGEVVETVVSRQGLYAMDEATWRWLGFDLIARPREAYRAQDILRFVHRLMDEFGKFDVLVLERGIWRAKAIRGYRAAGKDAVEDEGDVLRGEMSAEEQANLADGLRAIGVQIAYQYSPRGKAIEGAFRYLQDVVAVKTRDWMNLGAHRGEYERSARMLRRIRSGSAHPSAVGAAPINAMRDRVLEAVQWINAEPREFLGWQSSDALWARDMRLRTLPRIEDFERAVFLPELRRRMLRGGAIHFGPEVTGYKFSFRAAELFAELGDGYRVQIRFDPSDPTRGAAVLNDEPSDATRNLRRARPGQFLGWAPFELAAPTADVDELPPGHVAVDDYYGLGAGVDIEDTELRRQKKWHRTAGAVLPRPGQPALRVGSVRDGDGQAAEVADRNTDKHGDAETRRRGASEWRAPEATASRRPAACRAEDDPELREYLEEMGA